MNKNRQRFFSLIEIMISFLLILFCLVPLLYPNFAMYKEQTQFTKMLQIDYAVTVLHGEILEMLHRRGIPFEKLTQSHPVPIVIPSEALMKTEVDGYTVVLTAQKEFIKGVKSGRYIAALIKLTYRFQPADASKNEIVFIYSVPLVKLKPPSERTVEEKDVKKLSKSIPPVQNKFRGGKS